MMRQDWESTFSLWAQPPGKTEQNRSDNAIRAIRKAIDNSSQLGTRNIKVFIQGSYRNRVTVRQDSDVDVGVMCHDYFLAQYPAGMTAADFGHVDADYSFFQFKNELEEALAAHFGRAAVTRGNKAFTVRENSYRVEADVAPFFEFRQYFIDRSCLAGVALWPDTGRRIENFPERLLNQWPYTWQHYENGVSKNTTTGRRFKGIVRILKRLRSEMDDVGYNEAKLVPGYFLECLSWNVPNDRFDYPTWAARVQAVLQYLWLNTREDTHCKSWCEVDGIKLLFHANQHWERKTAHAFIDQACKYAGIRPQ